MFMWPGSLGLPILPATRRISPLLHRSQAFPGVAASSTIGDGLINDVTDFYPPGRVLCDQKAPSGSSKGRGAGKGAAFGTIEEHNGN